MATRKLKADGQTARTIYSLRVVHGWTRKDLADRLNAASGGDSWTASTVTNLELNRKQITPAILRLCADVFDVSVDYLVFGPTGSLRHRFRPRAVNDTGRATQLDLDAEAEAAARRAGWRIA